MPSLPPDVPSPIDLRLAPDAIIWASEAMGKRPHRVQFFAAIAAGLEGAGARSVLELRHKRRAVTLHAEVRSVLVEGGVYLVCDHYVGEDGMKNAELFMTVDEQALALRDAGFDDVVRVRVEKGLVLHRATKSAAVP